ncbi:DUF3006 domain-containing protein [Tissierella creatinophila]|uniref:Uncharacterized protein n=1 Tax=Tissierella creatinophila DSM 6911 TaxID=1123403 RepID=A0A1U7M7C9_TISCR|nr:DUF3006 domain-containing protein [Tissierella creatinophila]OLS03119.1 hypothetical protein TICRE_08200 [Tissierella creatinophila DSM 6911]
MKFIIDRFEGEFVVVELENRDMMNIPIDIIPKFAKEGDVLKIIVDEDETFSRKKRIEEKFKRLFKD